MKRLSVLAEGLGGKSISIKLEKKRGGEVSNTVHLMLWMLPYNKSSVKQEKALSCLFFHYQTKFQYCSFHTLKTIPSSATPVQSMPTSSMA